MQQPVFFRHRFNLGRKLKRKPFAAACAVQIVRRNINNVPIFFNESNAALWTFMPFFHESVLTLQEPGVAFRATRTAETISLDVKSRRLARNVLYLEHLPNQVLVLNF